ncbi:MAG TPA: YebC/PmpR family DNA-binding transcriptional regulator [Gammaproteobacteria bacterium]|nr:YebC/PmpR family DNA-binding transcriptional regulator [Gammaproteobacteria bacterium]
MAGHSKWANIKHKKAKEDAKRGKIFTKLIREITTAARSGADPAMNPRLRLAVDKAFDANMPKDTVERAIKRGSGGGEGEQYEEIRYEGYGVGGVAVMVDCMTDNRNRTAGEVRHAFSKNGGNLGADGSVAYLFSQHGVLSYEPGVDEEKLMEVALEAGAEDIVSDEDGSIEVLTQPEDYQAVRDALIQAGFQPAHAEITQRASTLVRIEDSEQAATVMKMIDMLEDLDDVQAVYTNADFPEEVLASL